ncbi:hypothetical protein D3C87_1701770 [compost metagenome]
MPTFIAGIMLSMASGSLTFSRALAFRSASALTSATWSFTETRRGVRSASIFKAAVFAEMVTIWVICLTFDLPPLREGVFFDA